jgi:tetratricopeptide (TPR) repeat protein
MARAIAGGLLTAAAVAGLIWVHFLARVELEFGALPQELPEESANTQALADLSAKLDSLLRRDPSNGVIRKRNASVLARLREHRRALEQLQAALNTNSTPDSLFFAGDMQDKLGNLDEAIARMSDAAMLNPTKQEYNDSYLRLLNQRLLRTQGELRTPDGRLDPGAPKYRADHMEFAMAARNWGIRAPHDMNSYLFLGNHFVGPPLYALQAYRSFLVGLSPSPWLTMTQDYMLERRMILKTIEQIHGGYAKPYRGLAFTVRTTPQRARPEQ